MAEFAYSLTPAPVLGADVTIGTTTITERDDLAIVSCAVPLGGDAALKAALKSGFGLDWPDATHSSQTEGIRALRTAPDQILLLFAHPTPDAEAYVQSRLQGSAYTTDQTDVWVVLQLSGSESRAALERICPLDIAPEIFGTGAFGRTVMEHMGAILCRTGPDQYLLMSASSSAGSFLHAVQTSLTYVTDDSAPPAP